MDNGDIDVSIIIPVYNGSGYLENCLESVVSQTLEKIEVICIDDGSTDDSAGILERYERRYPEKLRIFHTENQGVWRARELGLEKAQGTYVGFVDCDDHIKSDMYEKMFAPAAANRAEMAVAAYQRITETDRGQRITVEMNTGENFVWETERDLWQFPFVNTALWNKIILREIALKHVKFADPPRIAEDALFLMSVYPYVHCVVFTSEPLYCYYVRGNTAMSYVDLEETDTVLEDFAATKKYIRDATGDMRWDSIMEITVYIHLGVSLLLRCRLSESGGYIKKVGKFLREEFPGRNIYMNSFRGKKLFMVKIVRAMYATGMIFLVPLFKKFMMRIIKW